MSRVVKGISVPIEGARKQKEKTFEEAIAGPNDGFLGRGRKCPVDLSMVVG